MAFFLALAAGQVGTRVADEGERACVSRRCIKAERLRRAAQPMTRWACGICSLSSWWQHG